MIKAVNLTKTVPVADGVLEILRGIDLEIKRAESAAIVGASGSGKSTLLGLLAGLDEASSGEVFIGDACLSAMDEDQRAALRAREVGFVFQSFQLLPALTALENVMLPLELAGSQQPEATALSYLQRVGLDNRTQHFPKMLSGGEQQRVAIARAFAARPTVLFADEPTGNLDTATGQRIIDLLFELNQSESTTLVLVTHDQRLAARCQRQFTMSAGALAELQA
jgi:putative ABC transport system ATP-binding protein